MIGKVVSLNLICANVFVGDSIIWQNVYFITQEYKWLPGCGWLVMSAKWAAPCCKVPYRIKKETECKEMTNKTRVVMCEVD